MRILEIIISKHSEEEFDKILSGDKIIERWKYHSDNDQITCKALSQDDDAKELLQILEKRSIHRVVIYPVEGTLPKVEDPAESAGKKIKMGKFIALIISVLWGLLASNVNGILRDPKIEYQDVLLALVCGFAGVIFILSGQGSTLAGVMVAAALLLPLIRSGLLLGGADYKNALNAFLIFSTNVVCLNIAGIITFYLAGIRPRRWWGKETTKKKTRSAFIIWTIALIVLIITIILFSKFG